MREDEPTPIRRRARVDGRSKAFKAAVVGEAAVIGVRPAARKARVPESSVRVWQENPEFARLRASKRDEVQEEVWAAFQMGVHRIVELLPTTEDMNKVAVATGIIYDKFALMSGQATSRSESRDVTDTLDDHEREVLGAIVRRAAESEKVEA